MKKLLSTNTIWEEKVSYSRAVRVGNVIEVSGTTAVKDGKIVEGSPAVQTEVILAKIDMALEELGASLKDVVRTRIYVVDIDCFEEVGEVHGRFFKDINPTCTLLEVSKLVDPRLLVEIEATAIIDPDA